MEAKIDGHKNATGLDAPARRPRISLRAWVVLRLALLLAPDQSRPGALQRGIADNRKAGIAHPPKRMLKRLDLKVERHDDGPVYRLTPRGGSSPALCLLYLHGSGYVMEMHAVQWKLVEGLMALTDAQVVAPMYPLAPEHCALEGLDMVRRVYLGLVEQYGAGRIVVMGDSAGGGLALALAQMLRDAKEPLPAALVLFSPWLDVSVSGADQPELERGDPALAINFLREAGQMWARDLPLDDPRVSPLFGDHTALPPTIVFAGTRDILCSDARRLAERSTDAVIREYPEMMHVWPVAPIPEGRRALEEAAAFIHQHVARP
ncbi:MAG: alpha/beta hydrolase [Rhodospirillaceae bacterium]|nr:MAG: alpha/beta hydrolase [Rhodospirillaceae bacterium]